MNVMGKVPLQERKNECGERRRKERRMYPYGGKRSIVYGVVVE
jgi:hypothetical protein